MSTTFTLTFTLTSTGFVGGPRSPAPTVQPGPSIGTTMEDLLKGVPPNVAIKNINEQQAGRYLCRSFVKCKVILIYG